MENFAELAEGNLKRIIAIRLKPGTDVLKGLEEICKEKGIKDGVILSALGSLDGAVFCNPIELPEKKAGYGYGDSSSLIGPIELINATGLICHNSKDEVSLHIHMSLSDRHGNAHGGHLVEGTKVLLTVDMVIAELEGLVMGREFDPDLEVPIFAPRQK
ncbi:MAG: PPC domain-containing DNA-binding protein [Sedimentibacter sp.]